MEWLESRTCIIKSMLSTVKLTLKSSKHDYILFLVSMLSTVKLTLKSSKHDYILFLVSMMSLISLPNHPMHHILKDYTINTVY